MVVEVEVVVVMMEEEEEEEEEEVVVVMGEEEEVMEEEEEVMEGEEEEEEEEEEVMEVQVEEGGGRRASMTRLSGASHGLPPRLRSCTSSCTCLRLGADWGEIRRGILQLVVHLLEIGGRLGGDMARDPAARRAPA